MKTTIRPMGNSRGIIIAKTLLAQLGFEGEIEMTVERGTLVLRKPAQPARDGWAESAQRVAVAGDDALVMPEFANEGDAALAW
ncbi:MAG: AbrB/MazE/SpoVT family DNA-binding domain-containing protein [Burkholderiaceae bacterium]|nr:AbrB/MazE/SpoVT family DNA-binding domain-containing protein [Burkholderiaceae bacterium]